MQPLTITLRDKTYTAESPTRNELRIISSMFFRGETELERLEAMMETIDGENPLEYSSKDPADLNRATITLIARLDSPAVRATFANTLISLFPSLPETLVSYRLLYQTDNLAEAKVVWKLEAEEAAAIVLACLHYLKELTDVSGILTPILTETGVEPEPDAVAPESGSVTPAAITPSLIAPNLIAPKAIGFGKKRKGKSK